MKLLDLKTRNTFEVDFKNSTGNESVACPACKEDRKKKNLKPLSWDHKKGCGMCHHCQVSFVIFRELKPEKNYIRPVYNNSTTLSDKAVKWFQGRGISQKTIVEMKVTEGPEYMPQTQKQENTIQFNYFRNKELINVKFRDGAKNFKLVKDAELIFYNLDAIEGQKTCIITEGEIDCLSWIEAGIKNVVSVPNGASKSGKLEYLDNCIEYFDTMDKVYLSTDNDSPGIALRDELARRLGIERCYKIEFGNLKDANEYLMAFGENKLSGLIETATEFPMEGIYTVRETWEEIEHIFLNGLPSGFKTGDTSLDEHIGFMPGELTMVTGIPGHGKSIFLDQLSLGLSINNNWRFGVCSPESYPMPLYFSRIIKRIIGKKFSKNHFTMMQLHKVMHWLEDRYYLIMPEAGFSVDNVLEKAKQLVSRKGINCLILDPWNRIESGKPANMDDGRWIIICLTKIIEFAQRSGVHVFLVAHPTKMQKDKDGLNFMVPNLYNISGSAHFFNITHNGMTVFRNHVSGNTELHIQKVKWEHLGRVGMVEYKYNEINARFDNILRPDYSNWYETLINPEKYEQTELNVDQAFSIIYDPGEPPF